MKAARADHRPPLDLRIRVLHAHDFGGGILRRFDVVEGVDDLDLRILFDACFTPSTPVRRFGAF